VSTAFTETAESPLGGDGSILTVDPAVGEEMIADVAAWRAARDEAAVDARARRAPPGRGRATRT
jgi:hypothetical protein